MAKRKREIYWQSTEDEFVSKLWSSCTLADVLSVEGVATAYRVPHTWCFVITFDPRYDTFEVVGEIERMLEDSNDNTA